MPILIHLANLIIPKKIVESKYPGGVNKFISENDIAGNNHNQEDDELFAISRKFVHEFDIGMLIEKGFHYDKEKHISKDFMLLPLKGKAPWEVPWLESNGVFVWHKTTDPACIDRANFIAHEVDAQMAKRSAELGVNLLIPITKGNL